MSVAGPGYLCGVDLSEHQGAIDAAALAPHINFAIVRGGDGGYIDHRQEDYVRALAEHSVPQDVYHFMRLSWAPKLMAEHARASWERAQRYSRGAVGRLWLDLEDTSLACQKMEPAARIEWLMDVESRLAGIPLGIYTGVWWWRPYMADTATFVHLPLWLAAYPPGVTTFEGGAALAPQVKLTASLQIGHWQSWSIWQFTSSGVLPGITQNTVDLNIATEEVMGVATMTERLDALEAKIDALGAKIEGIPRGGPGAVLSFLRAQGAEEVYALVFTVFGDLRLRHVPDPQTFETMGGSWETVREVPPAVIAAIPQGKPFPSIAKGG